MGLASSACCQDATPVEAKEVVQESADPSGHSVANSPHEGIIDLQKLQLDMDCESGTATATTSVPARPTRLGVPSPCPTASSATRSRSANPRNLRNLTRLQIDQDLLRGISLRRSLRTSATVRSRGGLARTLENSGLIRLWTCQMRTAPVCGIILNRWRD
eukprot:s407_g13.t3